MANNLYGTRSANAGFSIPQDTIVPTNTLSEGVSPAGRFITAPYVNLKRYNNVNHTDVVIASGKPLALDNFGQIVPAGLRFEAEAYAAALATSVDAADAQALVRYSAYDVSKGVTNAKGVLVTANEPVVKSWFTGTTQDVTVSYFVGVAQYDILRHAGGDNINPGTIRNINHNPQPVIAFLSDYHMQYPVVKDLATVRSAALADIAAVVTPKAGITFGTFITYDRESNFVPCSDLYGYGDSKAEAIVGQVTGLRVYRDEDTKEVTTSHNFLEKVVAPNQATADALNQVPSSTNGGVGTYLTYSGGYAVVEFGIQTR